MANVRVFVVFLLTVVCLITGCGRKPNNRLPVFPVSGKLLIDGKAPVGAEILFHTDTPLVDPGGKTLRPRAVAREDGTFHPNTYLSNDGLPAGEYQVTVSWPKITIDQGEEIEGADRLGGQFANPQRPIAKVTVKEGENQIPPIELKSR